MFSLSLLSSLQSPAILYKYIFNHGQYLSFKVPFKVPPGTLSDILKISEGRWQIEACFRIMKTDFAARPVYLHRSERINAHFLICFLSLLVYRLLEKALNKNYTCEDILNTLQNFEFADVQGQGFMPVYESTKLTDELHRISGFETDYEFITKRKMREIQKLSKRKQVKKISKSSSS